MIVEVAKRMSVPVELILGRSEAPSLTPIRQIYWTLLRDVFGFNAKQIARMSNRSVSSIYAGIKHINDSLEMDDPQMIRLWERVKDLPGEMEMMQLKIEN